MIQSKSEDKFKNIFKIYGNKIEKDIANLYLIYNGNTINEELPLKKVINKEDLKRKKMNIIVNENNAIITKVNKIIKSKEIICPKCNENLLINVKDYKINLYNCKNGHNNDNIFLHDYENFQYVDLSKIICNVCKKNNKSNTYNNDFYKCISCNNNLCPLCKSFHNKAHTIQNYDNKNYLCEKHNTIYIKYCKQCKLNLCLICGKEHKNHPIANFEDIILSKEDYKNDIINLDSNINKLYIEIDNIITKLIDIKYNLEIYHKIYNDLINNYNTDKLNYEKLQNINEFKVYNKTIINEINQIIKEQNINNKFINLMDIYNRMNSKIEHKTSEIKLENNNIQINNNYEDKIKHIFEKDPIDLKFKMNITNTEYYGGYNDIFEVYTCFKDNKEYIASLTLNYIIGIFALLDNKKIISLYGHNSNIYTVRYFINNKDYNEYLISAEQRKVIVWDISNNYNIKFEFERENNSIYSCLVIFPQKSKENYLIFANGNNICLNSLTNGKKSRDIYCDKYDYGDVYYLLFWFNKKDNEEFIIELRGKSITIHGLSEKNEFYKLIHKPESNHYSGFIYNGDDVDYLCSSSSNGFINIWDLYNKKITKIIRVIDTFLNHIIQWNRKYIIVADYDNYNFKIINSENNNIIEIKGQHTNSVICVKKVNHPIYGESLLSGSKDGTIKLWSV